MLKSRFNIAQQKQAEEVAEEHHEGDEQVYEYEAEVAEEEKIARVERQLNRSEVGVRLSLLGLTADGDGFTYLKATCTGMGLTDISAIKCFKHLQYLDVSDNYLDLPALQAVTKLPHLVLLHADKNVLHSAGINKMKYLQVIIMNNNNITTVEDVFQPELSTLEVGYNKIDRVYFTNRMPQLKCLDFRYNLISDISGFEFPNLDSLYLAGNRITSLEGLERLVTLRILHARHNPIKLLNGFHEDLKKLQYINLRNCKVATLRQVKKLQVLPSLEALVLKGCPYMGGTGEEPSSGKEEDDSELRVEVLAALPRLGRLNKELFTLEERLEAKDLLVKWQEVGEKEEEEIEEEQQEEALKA